MKKVAGLLIVTSIFFLVGCGLKSPPSSTELISANFGSYPENYQEIIIRHFGRSLFDPYSAVYEFSTPRKAYIYNFEYIYGWGVIGTLNAKNRFGGYVGAKPFNVLIRDGRVINEVMRVNFIEQ